MKSVRHARASSLPNTLASSAALARYEFAAGLIDARDLIWRLRYHALRTGILCGIPLSALALSFPLLQPDVDPDQFILAAEARQGP